MTLPQLYQRIGRVKRASANLERSLIRSDTLADTCGHPEQANAILLSAHLRRNLQQNFTELHHLEARLPTPELLSERAFNRILMLGMTIDAAEAARLSTYRNAAQQQRHQHAA